MCAKQTAQSFLALVVAERALPGEHSVQSVGSTVTPVVRMHLVQLPEAVSAPGDPAVHLHGAMMRAGESRRIARTMAFI